jgi:hypothetical protein
MTTDRGDRLLIVLGHDHDPQRFDTSAAPSEIGCVFGCHPRDRANVGSCLIAVDDAGCLIRLTTLARVTGQGGRADPACS